VSNTEIKNLILDTVDDLVTDFLYYDRKDDDELTLEMLENAIEDKIITIEDVVKKFREVLIDNWEQ
jgi:hypothetical protein